MPPAGFKRSRALWDDTRRPKSSKMEEWKSLSRAILYELQPIRISQYNVSLTALRKFVTENVFPVLQTVLHFVIVRLPKMILSTIRHMTTQHWEILGCILGYYFIVRWIHEALHAGPIVLILTALAAIFTVGLREKAEGELSAYSVFNRGFQRLLGEVDADELANQYVGGAIMGGAADIRGGGGDALVAEEPEPRNNRNQNNNNNNHHRAAARMPLNNNDEDDDDGGGTDNNNDNNEQRRGGQSRKSGKKARRRNLEERQEVRRQREAAQAMGFDGTGGEAEVVAMQRLIEDQAVDRGGDNQPDD